MHGIAFSAAYQMVARFANKNTISLGLGCVGSGLLALALELILSVGPKPTRVSFIILFEIAAGATGGLCWDQHSQIVTFQDSIGFIHTQFSLPHSVWQSHHALLGLQQRY